MWTDPLVLSVLQPRRVVGHAQQGDDEVDHGKDAVEPQKVVPERHRNAAVTSVGLHLLCCCFNRSEIIGKVLHSLSANVGQCCSSKVFGTVACRKKCNVTGKHF